MSFIKKFLPVLLASILVSIGGISMYQYLTWDLVNPFGVLWFLPALFILYPCYVFWADYIKKLFNFTEKSEEDFGESN
jgi:hypothetical protein